MGSLLDKEFWDLGDIRVAYKYENKELVSHFISVENLKNIFRFKRGEI